MATKIEPLTTERDAIITCSELASKFDGAISALEKNNGDELMALSSLFYSIGDVKKDPIYSLASFPFYNFGSVINDFHPLIATPHMLATELKHPYETAYKIARTEGIQLLAHLKIEFCGASKDYEKISKALGKLYVHYLNLFQKRQSYIRTQPQLSPLGSEDIE